MAILKDKPATCDEAVRLLAPLVYKMAHKFVRNHKSNDFDDLSQQGFMGVVDAYNRYDAGAGMAFSSYAYSWIFAHINGERRTAYKTYNSTSSAPLEDHQLGTYNLPVEDLADYNNLKAKMDPTTRAIHAAREQGFTYQAIAEAMTKLGKPCTLHQVRRQHMDAIAQ
jgi:RNA polymerase sigma factor (sigma-70 family)